MLELDVILIPFAEKHFETLTESEKQSFVTMLDEADPDLFTWLMGFAEPKPEFKSTIVLIKEKLRIP